MFPPARRRTASWRRSHASGELKKRQLREAGVLKDPKSMAETRYTPMDKLKEHSKYKRMIEDLKQKIETVFRGLSNGTMNASKAAAKAEVSELLFSRSLSACGSTCSTRAVGWGLECAFFWPYYFGACSRMIL